MRKWMWVGVGIAFGAGLWGYTQLERLRVDVPEYREAGELVLLEQGWGAEQRQAFHHTAQGTKLVPYRWFVALEQPCVTSCEAFADEKYLTRFGLIRSVKDERLNPDGLPIGLAREENFSDPLSGKKYPVLGLTCAACHTGELQYGKYAVRIEGGVAMLQATAFQKALGTAVILTAKLPWKYSRFEKKVLGEGATEAQKAELKAEMEEFVERAEHEVKIVLKKGLYPNDAGFGRTDALTRIGNQVFGADMENEANYARANAPVRFPQVWDASWFTWVQYNSSIADPLVRNIGEALGVRAMAKLKGADAGEFKNSVNLEGLKKLEDLLSGEKPYGGLRSPKWPAVFPRLDAAKVEMGRKLYAERCAHCHLAEPAELEKDLASAEPRYWVGYGTERKFLDLKEVPVELVGTDPRQALDFMNRTAETGDLGKGRVGAGEGLRLVTMGIRDQFFKRAGFSDEQKLEWSGYRPAGIELVRAKAIYKPRPLNGVWAAAPYLHNGSVPSLYELLASREQRGKPEVWTGTRRFDPVKVGYEPQMIPGASRFDYSLPGNSNEGHYFEDKPVGKGVVGKALTEEQRWALVEFLKSL